MSEVPSGKKLSPAEKLMRSIQPELEATKIESYPRRVRAIYGLLKSEYEMYEHELHAQGKSFWFVGEPPIRRLQYR